MACVCGGGNKPTPLCHEIRYTLHSQFYEFSVGGSIILIFLHTHQVNLMVFKLFTRYKAVVTVYCILHVVTSRDGTFARTFSVEFKRISN
jgi:hypothetical protein